MSHTRWRSGVPAAPRGPGARPGHPSGRWKAALHSTLSPAVTCVTPSHHQGRQPRPKGGPQPGSRGLRGALGRREAQLSCPFPYTLLCLPQPAVPATQGTGSSTAVPARPCSPLILGTNSTGISPEYPAPHIRPHTGSPGVTSFQVLGWPWLQRRAGAQL